MEVAIRTPFPFSVGVLASSRRVRMFLLAQLFLSKDKLPLQLGAAQHRVIPQAPGAGPFPGQVSKQRPGASVPAQGPRVAHKYPINTHK